MEKWLGKVHHGDCIEIMNRMPAECIDLIVTSPPYNIRNSTGNGLKDGRGGKWKNAALLNGYEEHDDAMPYAEYVEWQRRCLTAHKHRESLEREIGFGFGALDYFCMDCGKLTRSIPLAEMNDAEKRRVGLLAGRTMGE